MQPDRSAVASAILCLALVACGAPAPPTAPSTTPVPTAPAVTGTPVPSPTVPETPSAIPSPEPRPLEPDELGDGVERDRIEDHLAALAEFTDQHGGDRVTGSAGFVAALRYVTATLEDAGYTVEQLRFAHGGVSGTNVVAERAGTSDGVVMIGAHLDTVAGSPGMNDDASGVTAILAIAEALVDLPPPHRTIRLAVWDAEEGGPIGSRAYVESLTDADAAEIVAYLNLDMVGSPNAVRLVYAEAGAAAGSERITARFAAHFDELGLAWEPIDLEGDSDHGPFTAAGIATGGLFSGGIEPVTEAQADRFGATAGVPADACSHRPCDTLDNVELATLVGMARAAAHVLAKLAGDGG
jgi:aminopeptidase S